MARTKKTEPDAEEKSGRALVDLPAFGLTSGQYANLPIEVADALESVGLFDTKAKE